MVRTFIALLLCSLFSLASVVKPHVNSLIQSPASSASLPTVDQVLDKYAQASGGKAALEKATSRVLKGEIEWGDFSGTVEHYYKAPNKYLSISNLVGIAGEGAFREGFNGTAAWSVNLAGAARDGTSVEAARIQRHRDFYRELRLKTLYPTITLKGKEKIGHKEAYVLELTPTVGQLEKMFFDTVTGLLLRHEYTQEVAQGVAVYEYNYDDYREVDGVKVAFLIKRTKPSNITIKVSEVKFNLNLDDAKFNKPAAK